MDPGRVYHPRSGRQGRGIREGGPGEDGPGEDGLGEIALEKDGPGEGGPGSGLVWMDRRSVDREGMD